MKKDPSIISGFEERLFRASIAGHVFVFLFLIPIILSACGGKMSLQEAKQVAVSMNPKALNTPPRRIDDILATLDLKVSIDSTMAMNFRATLQKPRPLTDNPATLADYYDRRGDAAKELGLHHQAFSDLRLARDYSRRAGINNHKLLKNLAYAEFICGNFKDAIELVKRSLRIKESPSNLPMP